MPKTATKAKSKKDAPDTSFKTPPGVGNYVNLVVPRAARGSERLKYGMLLAVKKADDGVKAFLKTAKTKVVEAAKHTFGSCGLTPEDKLSAFKDTWEDFPIRDGDSKKYAKDEAFHGCWLIACSNGYKPMCIDKTGVVLDSADDLYSGAIYRLKLSVYAWEHETGGQGISLNLQSAIKLEDGTRIGGGSDAKADFADEITEDADEPDDDEPA